MPKGRGLGYLLLKENIKDYHIVFAIFLLFSPLALSLSLSLFLYDDDSDDVFLVIKICTR